MRRDDLLPLGSRMRIRLALEPQTPEELRAHLDHMLEAAGNAALMTEELRNTLCEYALGNPRVLMSNAGELLMNDAKKNKTCLSWMKNSTSRPSPLPAPRPNAAPVAKRRVKELSRMPAETDLLVLEVPILEDEAVAALHTFLLDLVTQFENHYGHQLRRRWLELDALTRDPLEPWKRVTPSPLDPEDALDEDFNDDIPF